MSNQISGARRASLSLQFLRFLQSVCDTWPVDDHTVREQRPASGWPVWVALPLIGAVFAAGAVWSFREQTSLAGAAGFHVPELLPLTIDGFAISMAAVAWAASLDGRAAVFARVGITVGIACSAATNAAWAWQRSAGDALTVAIAAGIPVLAMVAFEVLLAEVRRQVQRRRGLPQPEPVPWPRLLRIGLAPISTLTTWRRLVLERTDPRRQFLQEGTWDSSELAASASDPSSAVTGPGSSRSASGSGTGGDQPRKAAAPTTRAEPAGSSSGTPTARARTSRTSTSKNSENGSGRSPKRSDTELVSQILANGWTSESLNTLSSRLRVSKRRATDLKRAALEQTAPSPNGQPSNSDPWAEHAEATEVR